MFMPSDITHTRLLFSLSSIVFFHVKETAPISMGSLTSTSSNDEGVSIISLLQSYPLASG